MEFDESVKDCVCYSYLYDTTAVVWHPLGSAEDRLAVLSLTVNSEPELQYSTLEKSLSVSGPTSSGTGLT